MLHPPPPAHLAAGEEFGWGCTTYYVEPHDTRRTLPGHMILTPIPREQLADALDRFEAGLSDGRSRIVIRQIRVTSSDRAAGEEAERHRLTALSFARAFGMPIHPEGNPRRFNWDGTALNGATEAYVILHEVAHFALAPPERRGLVEFGLGSGPDT
ncbi:MAG TPA: hypothetical protein VJX94_06850, partial [Stellaceae bacterium]|nr:hypothetical protein [Stellaceae bacterium]